MEKKLRIWLCNFLFGLSLSSIFATNTIPTNDVSIQDLGDCELPLPDSFRVDGFGSGYVSLAWNPNNLGDDYLLTIFQENNNGGFDSLSAILVYDVDTYTITNLTSPKAFKFRIQPVCPNGKVNTNVSAYTPPIVFILELTTTGISPNIYQYVPCENIPIPQKPTDWIGFQLFDLSTNSSATFQYEAVPNAGGKIRRVTLPNENQVLVAANNQNKWPITNSEFTEEMNFRVGKALVPGSLEFYETLEVDIHGNYVDICEYEFWTRPGFSFRTMKGSIGGNSGKIRPILQSHNIKIHNPINSSIEIFFEDSWITEKIIQIELRAISGNLVLNNKVKSFGQTVNIDLENRISSGVYILILKYDDLEQYFKVIVLND